ncbi:Radial spoke head protein 3 [Kappamyces sp. JEL0829]|nr:Radial spoke head protein 3 [Kappamyces sp. JEL0829]
MLSTNNPGLPAKDGNKETYTFAAEPKGVEPRKKFRDPNDADHKPAGSVNIMYDRRIHRGNTYASPAVAANAVDPLELQKLQEQKRRQRAKRKAENRRRARTPEPVAGRKHIDVQTDLYLEELSDKVPEAIAMTQTDAFINRAPSPLYIPQKSGQDVATQIYDGELFDFNIEVQPILDVLVGKTLEQALMEVNEEDELARLRAHHRRFEEIRNAEYAETQRLEDAERRRTEEKERRIKEQLAIQKEKQDVAEKIAARAFAKSYLQSLIPNVLDSLASNGYFFEKIEKEIESQFLPYLTGEVEKSLKKQETARALADDIIRSAIARYRGQQDEFSA